MQSRPFLVIFHEFTHVGGGQTFVATVHSVLRLFLKETHLAIGSRGLQRWWRTYPKTQAVLLANVYTPKHFLLLLWWILCGNKLIIAVHGVWYREWQSRLGRSNWLGWKTWWLLITQATLLFLAQELLVLSSYSAELVQSSFPFGKHLNKKITLIPGMIVDKKQLIGKQRNLVRSSLGLQKRKKVFLAVGRLERRKGFGLLIQAFGKLAKKNKLIHLILVLDLGTTSQVELVTDLANLIRITDCSEAISLIINPSKKHLQKLFAGADAYVLSSTELETFGFVTLEALQAGLPVIGFAAGATSEVLGSDLNSLLLTKTITASALAQKMDVWIELSPKKKQELRDLSLQRAKQFSSSVVAKSWLKLLGKYG